MRQRTAVTALVLTTAAFGAVALADSATPRSSASPDCALPVVADGPDPAMQAPVAPAAPTTGYALHEWGVVRFEAGVPEIVTSGFDDRVQGIQQLPPDTRPPTIQVRKPLIYLHPGVDFDHSTNIDITVSLAAGVLHEVWPTPGLGAQPAHSNAFTWSDVQVTDEACGPQTAPSLVDLPCSSLGAGHVCEAAELTAYLRPVPHCMTWDGVQAPVLLYNGQPDGLDPPVHFAEDTIDGARVSRLMNIGGAGVGPVYVVDGRQVYRLDTLDVMASWSTDGVVPSFWLGESDDALLASIRADLLRQGLTENEADDFVDAWRPDVLNTTVLPWRVFGFYDSTTIDAKWPLTATPAPDSTVRVMAFTIENPPVVQ